MGLQIIEEKRTTEREAFELRIREKWEQMPPEKLNPLNSSMGKVRLERTIEVLEQEVSIKNFNIGDLGCGTGVLTGWLSKRGAKVIAVDVAENALRACEGGRRIQGCLPYLKLEDETFDGVVLADVIAEIDPHLYRLTLSEVARLMKKEGWLLSSTPLDLHSYDALEMFLSLIETEFAVESIKKSYHRLYIYLKRWVEAPSRFVRSGRDKEYRLKQLQKRSGLFRWWFNLNSSKPFSYFWFPLSFLLRPLQTWVGESRKFLLITERLSELLWGEGGITHVILFARKKSLKYN